MRTFVIGLAAAMALLLTGDSASASISNVNAERGYLGVQISASDSAVEIAAVNPGTAAEKGGLRAGDAIVAVDGRAVDSMEVLGEIIADHGPGTTLELTIRRGGDNLVKSITLGRREATPVDIAEPVIKPLPVPPARSLRRAPTRGAVEVEPTPDAPRRGGFLGVRVEDGEGGIRIVSVTPGGPAARAKLSEGDTLVAAAGHRIASLDELGEILSRHSAGDEVEVTVNHEGRERQRSVRLASYGDLTWDQESAAVGMGSGEFGLETHSDAVATSLPGRVGNHRGLDTLAPAQRGWLGVFVEPNARGLRVDGTVEGGPAASSGLRADDVIVSVDDRRITDTESLLGALENGIGRTVAITVVRGETPREFEVTLRANPENPDVAQAPPGMTLPGASRGAPSVAARNAQPPARQRGWLGIYVGDSERGVLVDSTVEGGPAAQAGLLSNDVIVAMDGREVDGSEALVEVLESAGAGTHVDVVVLRGQTPREFELKLGRNPEDPVAASRGGQATWDTLEPEEEEIVEEPTMGFMDVTEAPRGGGYLGVMVEGDEGGNARISSVTPGSPAQRGRLQAGDVILALDGQELEGAQGLGAVLAHRKPGTEVEVTVNRNGKTQHRIVKLARYGDLSWQPGAEIGVGVAVDAPPEGRRAAVARGGNVASFGETDRGYLGVSIEDAEEGVRILEAHDGTAAAKAGLKSGDVITRIGEHRTLSVEQLLEVMSAHAVGARVEIRVVRGEKVIETQVKLGKRPNVAAAAPAGAGGVERGARAMVERVENARRTAERDAALAKKDAARAVAQAKRQAKLATVQAKREAQHAEALAKREAQHAKAMAKRAAKARKSPPKASPKATVATRGPNTFTFEADESSDGEVLVWSTQAPSGSDAATGHVLRLHEDADHSEGSRALFVTKGGDAGGAWKLHGSHGGADDDDDEGGPQIIIVQAPSNSGGNSCCCCCCCCKKASNGCCGSSNKGNKGSANGDTMRLLRLIESLEGKGKKEIRVKLGSD